MAAGMATGKAWFKVPEAIRFNLTGSLRENVTGKDVILHIIGMIGVDGALISPWSSWVKGCPAFPWRTDSA